MPCTAPCVVPWESGANTGFIYPTAGLRGSLRTLGSLKDPRTQGSPKDLTQGSLKTLQLTGRFPAVTLVKRGGWGLGRGSAPPGGLFAPAAGAPSAAPCLLPRKRVGLLLLQHVQLIPFLLRVARGWCSNLHAGASESGHGSGVLHNGLPVPIGLCACEKAEGRCSSGPKRNWSPWESPAEQAIILGLPNRGRKCLGGLGFPWRPAELVARWCMGFGGCRGLGTGRGSAVLSICPVCSTWAGNLHTQLENQLINMLPSLCLYGLEWDGFVLAPQVK